MNRKMNHKEGEKQGRVEPSWGEKGEVDKLYSSGWGLAVLFGANESGRPGSLSSNTLPLPLSSYEGFSGLKTWGWRRQPLPRVGTPKVKGRIARKVLEQLSKNPRFGHFEPVWNGWWGCKARSCSWLRCIPRNGPHRRRMCLLGH